MWIKHIGEEEADEKLLEIYHRWAKPRHGDKVSGIRRAQSMAPDILEAWLNFDHTVMYRQGGISRAQREMIATATSALNGCSY